MVEKKVQYFTDKEEAFVHLLIEIGISRTVAKVLVYLANIPDVTSRDIERGADLRQPEVSMAIQYLKEKGWIESRLKKTDSIGRPQNIISLSKPISTIIECIQSEKEEEIKKKMTLAKKIRNYLA